MPILAPEPHSPAVVGSAAYGVLVPPILLLAAVLAAQRVSFVLVGSAALRLRGEDVPSRTSTLCPNLARRTWSDCMPRLLPWPSVTGSSPARGPSRSLTW